MEEKAKVNPHEQGWDEMQVRPTKPIIRWAAVGESHTVTFMEDRPFEFVSKFKTMEGDDKLVLGFNVVDEDGVEKVILAQALTLKKALKRHSPLKDKTLKITRTMSAGKNVYKAEETKLLQVENVK